jgi:hypothetical protein
VSGIAYFWLAVGFLFTMLGGLIFVFSLQPEGGDRRYAFASWAVAVFFYLLAAWTFWRGL